MGHGFHKKSYNYSQRAHRDKLFNHASGDSIQMYSVMYPFENHHNHLLVGGFKPSEKYEFVSWDDYSQYMEK